MLALTARTNFGRLYFQIPPTEFTDFAHAIPTGISLSKKIENMRSFSRLVITENAIFVASVIFGVRSFGINFDQNRVSKRVSLFFISNKSIWSQKNKIWFKYKVFWKWPKVRPQYLTPSFLGILNSQNSCAFNPKACLFCSFRNLLIYSAWEIRTKLVQMHFCTN